MKKSLFILPFITLFSAAVFACGPFFEPEYLHEETPYNVTLQKENAWEHFVSEIKTPLPANADKLSKGIKTDCADIQDFKEALSRYYPALKPEKAQEIIKEYMAYSYYCRKSPMTASIKPPEMPEKLQEFILYLDGVLEMYRAKTTPATIPEGWQKLLSLPPEKRHYRTVWVHFMLGSVFKKDLHNHYKNCREAARQGFADTPGLARRSYILELRFANNFVKMLHSAVEAERIGIRILQHIYWHKINRADDGQFFALVNDPLCREIMAIFYNTPRFRKMVKGLKFPGAGLCAYYSFREKKYDEAKMFLASLPQQTLLSCWVEAKIARQQGNTASAVKALQKWLELAGRIPDLPVLKIDKNPDNGFDEEIYGLMGSVLVMRRDFMEAAVYFFKANQPGDTAHIAERFFTLDELTAFVEHPEIKKLSTQKQYAEAGKNITHLLARRAFREKRFDIAAKYMPEAHRKHLQEYLDFSKQSVDKALSPDERAIAMFNAAKILRFEGLELAGTELAPDFAKYHGRYGAHYPCQDCTYNKFSGNWKLCKSCQDSCKTESIPGFNAFPDHQTAKRRFHYRYLAAEMLLTAGKTAQDKDLRALIYMLGKECLNRDQEADIFYKRLVLECRGTLIGELADRRRWFPDIKILRAELFSTSPLRDMAHVREIMAKAFPGADNSMEKSK